MPISSECGSQCAQASGARLLSVDCDIVAVERLADEAVRRNDCLRLGLRRERIAQRREREVDLRQQGRRSWGGRSSGWEFGRSGGGAGKGEADDLPLATDDGAPDEARGRVDRPAGRAHAQHLGDGDVTVPGGGGCVGHRDGDVLYGERLPWPKAFCLAVRKVDGGSLRPDVALRECEADVWSELDAD